MIKKVGTLSETKEKIKSYLGKDLEIKVNLGRNKFVSYTGTITNVYPALFQVTPSEFYSGKTSFSYSEYMCGLVRIKEK
ncbi:MAG: Veg family protein [Clostridia bacterium]|nr:Veg family protein [Clostridia bacterium]